MKLWSDVSTDARTTYWTWEWANVGMSDRITKEWMNECMSEWMDNLMRGRKTNKKAAKEGRKNKEKLDWGTNVWTIQIM